MSKLKHYFFSTYSPFNPGIINQGSCNIQADWFRLANEDAQVNQIRVLDYKETYGRFETEENIRTFFSNIILENIDTSRKEKAKEFLMKTFHQGSLMYPVSSSFAVYLNDTISVQPMGGERQLRIISTSTGFKVQEIFTVKKINLLNTEKLPQKLMELVPEVDGNRIMEHTNYLIKAGATIDVDFSKDPQQPLITVESNYISYGNKTLKSALDKRNLVQIIIDFFRRILRLNVIEVKSSEDTLLTTTHKAGLRPSHHFG